MENENDKIGIWNGINIAGSDYANKIFGEPYGVTSDLFSVGKLSTELGLQISDHNFLKGYTGALELQDNTLHTIFDPNNGQIQLNDSAFSVFASNTAPVTGAFADLGFLKVNSTNLRESGIITSDQFLQTEKLSNLFLDTLQNQQTYLIPDPKTGMFTLDILTQTTDFMNATRLVGNGVDMMIRSLPAYPTDITAPSLEVVREIGEIKKGELSEHQKKLDGMLEKVDPEFVKFRRGCWDTFTRKGDDYIGQASSSMRRLVDNILRVLAPDSEVEKTAYFLALPKDENPEKNKPTRKARIYYAVEYDLERAKHLERLATGFEAAYGNLSAWDHVPLDKDGFVHGAFIAIEGYLISLLSEAL